MKEIKDIVCAFEKAATSAKACALATVVHVEGSSYRRPGARMLVTDDGMLTGAISGGCLEGDALRKALLAIAEGKNKLVTYNTMDEDDAKFGVQLGCNGIVHILFEPINIADVNNPISFLKKALAIRETAVLATLFSLKEKRQQIGTCYLQQATGGTYYADVFINLSVTARDIIIAEVAVALATRQSLFTMVNNGESECSAFIQCLPPPVSLFIVGAGNDVLPLVAITQLLGWDVTIIDGRSSHANSQRFSQVKNIIISKPEIALSTINIDNTSVIVIMTHNYNYDIEVLKQSINMDFAYIGMLGPKTKMQRMYDGLQNEGIIISDEKRNNIYSPVGLDIGAETAEEIALSIVAEIKAVLMGKNAQMLRHKEIPIHQ
ncbi:MAG: XdhC family protein [Ferruginibacter sp.]|nr:XdhC family protein [Ferruginibacter sp.]